MQKSADNVIEPNPNTNSGDASYATLMESLKKAESHALVWPKHKRLTDLSSSIVTIDSIMSSSPVVKRSAISLLRQHFDKARKYSSDVKSNDYFSLRHKGPSWNARKWLGDEHQKSLLNITLPTVPEAKPLSERKSLQEPVPYIKPHYQVPTISSKRPNFGRKIGIEAAIFKMLKEISIPKKPRVENRIRRSSAVKKVRKKHAERKLELGYKVSHSPSESRKRKCKIPKRRKSQLKWDLNQKEMEMKEEPAHIQNKFIEKSKTETEKFKKPKKYTKKAKQIKETKEPTESLLTETKSKKKDRVKPTKKSSLDSAEQNAKSSSSEERKLSSISREMQEFITNIKKKAQERDSVSTLSHIIHGVRKSEPRAKSKEHKKKRSLMSEEFDAVNREIFYTLDDPLVIDVFKKNIKILSAKDCKPFLRKFLDNEKIPNLRDPFDVQRYLNNLDRTVRKARISIEKRKRSFYEPVEDSISLDLEDIERQAFRSYTLRKSRGRRSKSRSLDGRSTTSSIGNRKVTVATPTVNVPYYGAPEEAKTRYQFDAKEFYQLNKKRKVAKPMDQYYLKRKKEQVRLQKTPTAPRSDVAPMPDVTPKSDAQIDKKPDVETDLTENEFDEPWDETANSEEVEGAPQNVPMTHAVLTSLPLDQPQRQFYPIRNFTQNRYLTTEQSHYINNFLIPPINVPIRKKSSDSTKRIKSDRLHFEALFKDNETDLPFVGPVTYEQLSKLTADEFFKYFSGLHRDARSLEYLKSSLAMLKNDLSVTYNYRVDQVRRYLYDSDVNLSDLDNISIDDIDLNAFLNYPYPEKYVEEPSDPRMSVSVHVEKVPSKKKLKTERPKRKKTFKTFKAFKCEKHSKDKISEDVTEQKLPKFKRSNTLTQHSCCICKSLGRNDCMRDDPLIVKMKNEVKRRELKAYIREKQLLSKGLDEIFTNNRYNRPVLVPCEKPRACNQVYMSNVYYRNCI